MRRYSILIWLLLITLCCIQCLPGMHRNLTSEPLPRGPNQYKDQYLKVHMKDGSLYILNLWVTDEADEILTGRGDLYDLNRKLTASSADTFFQIRMSQVALYESNNITGIGGKVGLQALVMAPMAIFSLYCLINPKACFGSCPTFYAWNGHKMELMAEGFSSSIARIFEKTDIDMLHDAVAEGGEFRMLLTNEALETHAVKYADLLLFPRKKNERVYADGEGKFFLSDTVIAPSRCFGSEEDCLERIRNMDGAERFSKASPTDLNEKEEIELTFENIPLGKRGIVIGSRQTLMTTYLFYQGLAYAGWKMPDLLAEVERGNKELRDRITGFWERLGGIEIFVQSADGSWKKEGMVDEMGPIASDLHLVRLPENHGEQMNVRLRMSKGLYRIDQVALVSLDREVFPIRISPQMVLKDSLPDENALKMLNDTTQYLATFPGDRYELVYQLPETGKPMDLFLSTRGYYLEWMRETWCDEENLFKLNMMFRFPELYLSLKAGDFSKAEPFMEESFWNSRYVQN